MTEHPDMLQLSAHHDGELDSAETAHISRHLLSCRECQRQYRQLQVLSRDLLLLPDAQPELDIAALLDRLPERQPQTSGKAAWHRLFPGMAAAASLVLGLLLGTHLHSPPADTRDPVFAALAILDSTPPGALCRQPELCYLQGSPQ